jgi:cell division protein FtsI/penicillin-binding protein 2
MRPNRLEGTRVSFSNIRIDLVYFVLMLILATFVVRLFYIQVIQHAQYKEAALSGQLKEYLIPPERGIIEAYDGDNVVPIVLNEAVYTLFADPVYIKDIKTTSDALSRITGKKASDYEEKMTRDTRYAVLEKRLNENTKSAIESLDIKGVGLREESVRTYPQGELASQILGFVNDEGVGTYGLEQFLDDQLGGQPGQLKAITDVNGVPLVSNPSNIIKDPVPGERVRLTLDIGMQKKAESILKSHLPEVNSKSGSVVIIDPNNGAIKAMANYPTFDPRKFSSVDDVSVFTNPSVSEPLEVGSVMKTLTVATALNEGAVKPNQTFFDPAKYTIDGASVRNVEGYDNPQTRSISDILKYSLNTGAVWLLKQLGGGEVNEHGRTVLYKYLTEHYFFGQKTGIEQGYEAEGIVPDPVEGFGRNIKFANAAFGQGISVTPLQFASAFSATINGGIYYRPHLVDGAKEQYVRSKNVVKPKVSKDLRLLHENTVHNWYHSIERTGYRIGGKTGTAQIPGADGSYRGDVFNGTFIGYVGGDKPEYVIMVKVDEPHVSEHAGIAAAAPLFGKISNMLIDDFSVSRKTN